MFNEVAYEDKRLHRLHLSEKDTENVYKCSLEVYHHFHLLKTEEKRVEKCLQAKESVPSFALLPSSSARTSTCWSLPVHWTETGNHPPLGKARVSWKARGCSLHPPTSRRLSEFSTINLLASHPTSTLHHLLPPPLALVHPSLNIILRLSTTFVTSTRSFQKLSLTFPSQVNW